MTSSDIFRDHMAPASAADPAVAALVIEAGRIIDRLDQLDGIITGKTEWISLMHFRVDTDPQQVTVTIDGVLAEARQQSAALNTIFTKLGIGKAEISPKVASRDPLDEIAARRSARGGGTARLGRATGGKG